MMAAWAVASLTGIGFGCSLAPLQAQTSPGHSTDALQAQMLRVQIEQGAAPGFAQQAYAAQQEYLQATAEKSYRIGKPKTAPNARPVSRLQRPQPHVAAPPVHIAPGTRSIAPVPRRSHPGNRRPAQYAAAQYQQTATAAAPRRAAAYVDIPTAQQLGRAGESYDGPTNRIGLQNRITNLLSKPKYKNDNDDLPSPKFDANTADREPTDQLADTGRQRSAADPIAAKQSKRPTAAKPEPAYQPSQDFVVAGFPQTLSAADESRVVHQESHSVFEQMSASVLSHETKRLGDVATQPDSGNEYDLTTALIEPFPPSVQSSQPPANFVGRTDNRQPRRRVVRPVSTPTRPSVSVLANPSTTSAPPQQDSNSFGAGSGTRQSPNPASNSFGSPGSGSRGPLPKLANPEKPKPANDFSFGQPDPAVSDSARQIEDLQQQIEELKRVQGSGNRNRRLEESDDLRRPVDPDTSDIEEELLRDELPEESDDTIANRNARTCQDFRNSLLNRSIREISLDMSPRASKVRDQYIAISRSWTDRLGNIVASGTMVDLRRGYVIIDGLNGRQKVPYAKLSDADLAAVSEYWQIPELCSLGDQRLPSRNWAPQNFTWTASALCHKPLYFENQQLERYGHTHGPLLQPIQSAAHFFVSLATLPYASAIHPPNECRYALGYYRPGNCAPWLKDPVPISLDGLRRQALATTGLALIP